MRNTSHLNMFSFFKKKEKSVGAKSPFICNAKFFFVSILLFLSESVIAQQFSTGNEDGVTVTMKPFDDCNTIFQLDLTVSSAYYFVFNIMKDGKMISPNDLKYEGEAANFSFQDSYRNVVHSSGEYSGSTTFYLNTRAGTPYIFTSVEPSTSDYYVSLNTQNGSLIVKEGNPVSLVAGVCPVSTDYIYRWYENGTLINETTVPSLSNYTPNVNNGDYKMEVVLNDIVVADKSIKLLTIGTGKRFTLESWYGLNANTSAAMEIAGFCNSVYRLNLTFNGNDPKFAIKENGIELGLDKITVDASLNITSIKGDDGVTPAWSISGETNGTTLICYLDTRTTPYKLTETLSASDFVIATISQTQGGKLLERGESVAFTSTVCASNESWTFSYQWEESTDKEATWTEIAGATSASLTNTPDKDSTFYRLKVTTSEGTEIYSNVEMVAFFAPELSLSVTGALRLNAVEHEIEKGREITIYATVKYMSDVIYSLQYRNLENNAQWRDTVIAPVSDGVWTFVPDLSCEYRVIAEGIAMNSMQKESYSEVVLVRIIYTCDSNSVVDTLWYDDFGHFLSATEYVAKDVDGVEQTYSGTLTDIEGNTYSIENYWTADPNFFVRKHNFALLDPWVTNNTPGECKTLNYRPYRCWDEGACNGYRVEDTYYAILPNPNYSNCGKPDVDYWNGSDHTGNTNGGMLFVNCGGDTKNTIIYQRDITINNNCDNVQLLFSAFISNAAIKENSQPVNVRLDILDETGSLVHSVSSGDVQKRDAANPNWSNLTFKFKSTGQKYTIQLTNNNEGGAENPGNDILLDDISITICYPSVQLITDRNNPKKGNLETCQLDTVVSLIAYNENGLTNYIAQPKYIFQYKKEGGSWVNLSEIIDKDSIGIELTRADVRFHGETRFRVIVASNETVINSILGGNLPEVNCEQVYAIDSSLIINFHYSGPMGADIDISGCVGETMKLIGDPSQKPRYEWVDAATHNILGSEKEYSFTIAENVDVYNFFFIGYEKLGCPDTQKVVVRKKDYVTFDAPKSFIACEYDSLITLTSVSPTMQTFVWNVNGTIDEDQTDSTFLIPQAASLKGTVKVTGVAENYCSISKEISYEIYKKFELSLVNGADNNQACITSETSPAEVILTATTTPAEGKPAVYYWYQNGEKLGETSVNTYKVTIAENGQYIFTVKAIDNVCRKLEDDAEWAKSNKDTVDARKPIKLTLLPQDTVFCEGESINIRAQVENALTNDIILSWKGEDIPEGTTTTGVNPSKIITSVKSNTGTENRKVIITTIDEVCTSNKPEATASYEIHNKIKILLQSKREDDRFCLTSGTANTIELTAIAETGVPTEYEWYKEGVVIEKTLAPKNVVDLPIEKGTNKYSVKVTDGVCTSKAQTQNAVDDKVIEAREPIALDITPTESKICEGESIEFTVNVTNPLDDKTVIKWSGDDVADGTTTTGTVSKWSVTPIKNSAFTEEGKIAVTTTDSVCVSNPTAATKYYIHKKIQIKLHAENIEDGQRCMNSEELKTVKLWVSVLRGKPTNYIWFDGQFEGDSLRSANLEVGTNQFWVKATDGVCNIAGSEAPANLSIETREPIKVELSTEDEKTMCVQESVELIVKVDNSYLNANTLLTWSPEQIADISEVSNGTYKFNYTPSVGQTDITVTVSEIGTSICPAEISNLLSLNVQDSVRISISADDNQVCQDGNTKINLTTTVISGMPGSIKWSTGEEDFNISDNRSEIQVLPLEKENEYWSYAIDEVCGNSHKVFTEKILVTNKTELTLVAEPEEVQMGETVKLTVITSNNEHGTFKWYTGNGILIGETDENIFEYLLKENGSYGFYVETDNGYCGDIESTSKEVEVADYTVVPNVITPYNGNPKNDVFMGPKDGKTGYKVEIYNRYQQLIYEGDNGWDGTYRGKLADPGTYFYRIFKKDGRVLKGTVEVAKF